MTVKWGFNQEKYADLDNKLIWLGGFTVSCYKMRILWYLTCNKDDTFIASGIMGENLLELPGLDVSLGFISRS